MNKNHETALHPHSSTRGQRWKTAARVVGVQLLGHDLHKACLFAGILVAGVAYGWYGLLKGIVLPMLVDFGKQSPAIQAELLAHLASLPLPSFTGMLAYAWPLSVMFLVWRAMGYFMDVFYAERNENDAG